MTKRIFTALVLLMAMPALVFAQLQPQSKPWAKLSNGVLTFWYGPKPAPPSQVTCTGCGKKIAWSTNYCANCGAKNPKDFPVYNALDTTSHFNDWRKGVKRPWYDKREEIKKVVFETSFKQVTNIYSTEFWFYGMENLETIVGMENLNTSNVTSMRGMFEDCYKLTSLDVTRFNTAKVTDMSHMFDGCSNLTSLDVTRFNTAKVTDMSFMFGCYKLTSLDVTHFNTENVTNMRFMFDGCSNLTSLDLSHLNTTKVKSMERMFGHCSNLESLDLSHFNTTKVKNMSRMFLNCAKLKSLNLSNFNTDNVEYMEGMFDECRSLVSLDLSHFNTSKVKRMSYMFESCEKLTTLDISNFDTRAVEQGEMRALFYNSGLKTIYVSATTWAPQRFGYQGSWQNTLWDNTDNFECHAQIIKK